MKTTIALLAVLVLGTALTPAAAADITRAQALRAYQTFYLQAAREAGEDRFRFGPEELNDFENLWKQSKEVADYYRRIGQPEKGYTGPGYGKSWSTLWTEYRQRILRRFEPTFSRGGRGGDLDLDGDGRRDDDAPPPPEGGTMTESFDRDPDWDGVNNRNNRIEPRRIVQDFGFSPTANAGGEPGEIGGFITPAGEPAYYGKPIGSSSLASELSASGKVSFGEERAGGNTLVGFFNTSTVNEWRTPNSLGFRFYGRGDGVMVEIGYCTGLWRAGATVFQAEGQGRLFPAAGTHSWSLRYEPAQGRIVGTFDGEELVVALEDAHREDPTRFTSFGILNVVKSADGGGELWLDDLTINGEGEAFDEDPRWEALGNRSSQVSPEVRFRFNFGYSPTNHAGGRGAGEMGGLLYRGDDRNPVTLANYGAELDTLDLEKPLRASGTVALLRAHSDSSVLFGFFNSKESMKTSGGNFSIPENFLGISTDGPSSEGFFFSPTYGTADEREYGYARDGQPRIYPDAKPRRWSLEYSPEGNGTITVTLDGRSVVLKLRPEHRRLGATFDRFGIITTHLDGNGQEIYFDDLTFTATQREASVGRN